MVDLKDSTHGPSCKEAIGSYWKISEKDETGWKGGSVHSFPGERKRWEKKKQCSKPCPSLKRYAQLSNLSR